MDGTEHQSVTIAYVGGGSLNWAPKLMADLAADGRLSATVRLYDIDHAAAERNARIGRRFAAASPVPTSYEAVAELGAALEGADVVVVSILPGRFEDMAHDLEIPARHGVIQSVGDTVGPGGFVRALRAIPETLEVGAAIARHAPEACVCNLTNPLSVLTGALYRAHPDVRAWGACHEVTKLRKIVAWLANRDAGAERWGHREVEVNVLGINHFTFVDRIALAGRDMLPAYRAFAAANLATGWSEVARDPDDEHGRYFDDDNRVKFDLIRRFGIAAAAGDRHLAEFLPQSEYLDRHGDWGFGLTPVDYRIRDRDARRRAAEALDAGAPLPPVVTSDEALVDQIVALTGGPAHVGNVNLPNRGQIAGLPEGAVVETNAVFSGLGVQPVVAGRLPRELEAIVADHARRQHALLEAVAEGRWAELFALFHSDPLVAPLPEAEARAMWTEMVRATSALLPDALVAEAA